MQWRKRFSVERRGTSSAWVVLFSTHWGTCRPPFEADRATISLTNWVKKSWVSSRVSPAPC